jgi:hypothetical protein
VKIVRLIRMCLNEMGSACRFEHFSVKNGLKGDDLSPLLFNSVLEYAFRKVQEKQEALKLNGTHPLADDLF